MTQLHPPLPAPVSAIQSSAPLGLLLCGLAMVLVGSTVVASKLLAARMDPFAATAWRHALALPVFLALMVLTRTPWPRLPARAWGLLLAQAAAGSVGYTVLLMWGTRLTSAADAGVMTGTLPAISGLLAVLVLGERPHRRLLAALGLATLGVMALQAPGQPEASSLLGLGLVLAAVVCEAGFILLHKRLAQPVSPLALSSLMSALGLVLALPLALLTASGADLRPGTSQLWALAYYAWGPTVLGFWLWYAGSQRCSGAQAALSTALMPVAAVALSVLWLGEPLALGQGVGLLCVVLAVGLAVWPGRQT